MRYKVYYSDVWNNEDYPVVNEWIFIEEKEIPNNYSRESILKIFIYEDKMKEFGLDDSEEILYIINNLGVPVIKLEPEIENDLSSIEQDWIAEEDIPVDVEL